MENQDQAVKSAILSNINSISSNLHVLREKCLSMRKLMDEGTYKLDSAVKIINNLKVQESNIMSAAGDPAAVKQLSEEQIDDLLEMLKTPAFQSLARQVLYKWVNPGATP